MKYKLGLVSVSFRSASVEEIFRAAANAGLAYVEWGSDVHAPKDDPAALEKIAALQEKTGIRCSSYGTYFRLGVTPLEELDGYLTAALFLGTKIVRLWCGDKNSEDYTPEEKEALFDACKKAAALAEEKDVTLCMECHNKTYTNRTEAALELMQAVSSPHFLMYWQPNQLRSEEENRQSAALLSPYTRCVHVFNWKGKEKFPLCQAKEIWKDYLDAFPKSVFLLLEFMPDGKIESLSQEAETLKEIAR